MPFRMNPDLERLIRLQRAEADLRGVEAELGDIPRQRDGLSERIARERSRLDAFREGLSGSQKARRQLEAELQDLEGRRSRYKGQLMEVKTNKEYSAMLHEIEAVEREIRSREDRILEEMERAETLAADLKREDAAFKEVEAQNQAESGSLDEREQILKRERERLAAERDGVATTLTGESLSLFQRVARLRGVAVAEARDGMCQLCHMVLRPQMYVDLKRNEVVTQCPACSRILYYAAPVPAVSPEA
jgi:predicted  nucleic acid-binding Zn-ribbon protein